jgi:hypothetical protein
VQKEACIEHVPIAHAKSEAQSRFGGLTEDSKAVVMLDFDAGASVCARNGLLLNDIQVTGTDSGDFDTHLADDIGNAGDAGSEMARQ